MLVQALDVAVADQKSDRGRHIDRLNNTWEIMVRIRPKFAYSLARSEEDLWCPRLTGMFVNPIQLTV